MSLIFLIIGLILLVVGAEMLVRGASKIAAGIGISPLVIGLTIVAFGTSSPEFAVGLGAALSGQGGIAVGNVVGSNIFNVLFILGISALITPLTVNRRLVRVDVPLMIGASVAVWLMTLNQLLGRFEGAVLFLILLGYTATLIIQSRREQHAIQQEYAQEFGLQISPTRLFWLVNGIQVLVGLAALVLGSRWLVDAATAIARGLGVSELVIGLTIVAIGTSLPEVVTSIVAAIKGEKEIAVGNVVGSNIFNLLGVFGLTALIAPDGIPFSTTVLAADLPLMIGVALLCLPIFFSDYQISRLEGAVFLILYILYTVYLFLTASSPSNPSLLRPILPLLIGLPLIGVALLVGFLRPTKTELNIEQ